MSLNHYRDLASNDEETRLKAAYSLLSELSSSTTEVIEYALNRLIRGLASGRESSRLLAQLLNPTGKIANRSDVDFARVLDILKSHTHPEGSVAGQEERDHYFGRLFGLEALIKSSILFLQTSPLDHWIQVLDLIFELAKKKTWLREECGWIVYDALPAISEIGMGTKFLQVTVDRLCANGLAKTPEGVAIWLYIYRHDPKVEFPGTPWRHKNPLDSSNITTLAKVLKEAPPQEEDANGEEVTSGQKGSWNSKLHFAWNVVLSEICSSECSIVKAASPFRGFWQSVVDGISKLTASDSLFSAPASEERKLWGFLAFCKMIGGAPEQLIPDLFSKNFMRCLINQLSNSERFLHRAAQKSLRAIHSRVEADPEIAYHAITGLLSGNGTPNFDHITKTRTVEKILIQANNTALVRITQHYDNCIQHPSTDDLKAAESRRQLLADQLIAVLRNGKSRKSDEWTMSLLSMFVRLGYFTTENAESGPSPPLSEASRNIFRTRLSSCLAHLISSKYQDDDSWPFRALNAIRGCEQQHMTSVIELDDTIQVAKNSALKRLDRIHKKKLSTKKNRKATLYTFELLFSLVILLLYNGDSDALSVLDELRICYDKLIRHKNTNRNDTNPTEVLIEILLSFISKPSVLLRKLAQQVFSTFAGDIRAEGLQLLLNVLKSKENLAGQQELFDQEADDDVESEAMSDVEVANVDAPDSTDTEDDSEGLGGDVVWEDIEDGSSNADDIDDGEVAKLDAALAAALGTRRMHATKEGGGSPSDDESDMNDEDMMAIDDTLVKIFKERKRIASVKQQKKDAKETITNFKIRVLDLLEIFIRLQHRNVLSLGLILPLLELIRSTSSKQIRSRAATMLKDYARACKGNDIPPPNDRVEDTWILLKGIHGEAMKEASHAHSSACSQASLLVAKVLVGADRSNANGVVGVYAETWTKWLLSKKCKVQPSIFSDFVNWSINASKQLQR
ncbi:MAG: DNA-directed DNA polymerase [Geoglossum simile]|nr:MAG: DNA-directed DNA polymerase [Geoglossum simile]